MEKRLNGLLRLALQYQATDIHFTNYRNETKIEMRIHDVIRQVKVERGDDKLIRYLQYLANLDVGNLLRPQTGQFDWFIDDLNLSLRFALIADTKMENGVLRILNDRHLVHLDHLSSNPKQNAFFKQIVNLRNGLFITSGPTGSGKTTTLYSMLESVKNKKIFTIEDPVEIHAEGFVQIGINRTIGFDYDEAIKQVLRHDPDIIMIGEIRDEVTAKMAIRAANTGHLVLSTIHAPNCLLSIERMLELGVSRFQLGSVLVGLSSQRLFSKKDKNDKIVFYETMSRELIEAYFNGHLTSLPHPLKASIKQAVADNLIDQNEAYKEIL